MKVAIVDTETTGVAAHDEPISVGILLVEIETASGKLIWEIARYHGWREPRVAIHPKAYAVHGKSADDLAGKVLDLASITSLIDEAEVLVAHNAQFDARMLSVVCDVASTKPWLCSLQQFPWPTTIGRKKLDSVCEFYGVARASRHDALADCEALLAVLLVHTGKTTRSRTFLALLLAKAPVGLDLPARSQARPPVYYTPLQRPVASAPRPRQPTRPVWDVDPIVMEPPGRRLAPMFTAIGWGVVVLTVAFLWIGAHS